MDTEAAAGPVAQTPVCDSAAQEPRESHVASVSGPIHSIDINIDYVRRVENSISIAFYCRNGTDFSVLLTGYREQMVERVSWMAPVDYEILLFDDHPIKVTPKVLAVNIDYDRQYVSKRCGILSDAGLLESVDIGLYELTELGDVFLEGEIGGRELKKPDE